MRNIKFRGNRVNNGGLVYGDLIHGQGSKLGRMYILPQTAIYPKGCHSLDGWEVLPETVSEFTGLSDWDYGTEIYEDDVVSNGVRNYVIKLLNACFWLVNKDGITCHRLSDARCEIRVLGSIHDNPELLTETNQ